MKPAIRPFEATRAAAVFSHLRRTRATLPVAQIAEATGLYPKAVQAAVKRLIDHGLVLVEIVGVKAMQGRPPGALWLYSAVADAEWPDDWLPMPDEPDSRPGSAEGGIVASAMRNAAPSVWAWAGNDSRRAAA